MLTADNARELAGIGGSVEDNVNEILLDVEQAAKEGLTRIRVTKFGFGEGRPYSEKPNARQAGIIKKLQELGYQADVKTEELQFVEDIYLLVRWDV